MNSMILELLFVLISSFAHASGAAGDPGVVHETCALELRPAPYSLDVMRARGFDPDALSFKFYYYKQNDFELRALVRGQVVGTFNFSRDAFEKRPLFRSAGVYINEDLKGKGFGSFLYIAAAEFLREQLGATLRSDYSREDDAVMVWERFIRSGLAYENFVYDAHGVLVDRYTQIRKERIEEVAAEAYTFLRLRLENPEALEKLRGPR